MEKLHIVEQKIVEVPILFVVIPLFVLVLMEPR